ncbi:MAG: ferredoxin-NADP reductase [Candidatus Schekmanbacteria bacterium RBG_13_48_7]|uniref:Ferredoxin-NADP reductase n=1 Tax=Candidatus Schekmanbacteria bacterium RBG_13_48_7 TaxID=1817878 RepID=A0A1F7RS29_9BACT|nr:MAG: ferredoxin-NADP reductase [Candidatus Schekmanbacteria bacterium RBG_13_48_7]
MNRIVLKKELAQDVVLLKVEAPVIAKKRKAGQFIILRIHEYGERIPLTIADSDLEDGTITLIIQGVGKTTIELNSLKEGEYIQDIVGPLGTATHIENFGTTVPIGGGIGIAVAYPIAKALKEEGNKVISIIGARRKDLLILEDEIRSVSDEVFVCTDDGSYGEKGFVTDALQKLIDRNQKINQVITIGPLVMMKAVANLTKKYTIPTQASLNPIMIDGTGMCGGCRVSVDGKSRLVCVDGPEFDAHQIDFDELMQRLSSYRDLEQESLKMHVCKLHPKE